MRNMVRVQAVEPLDGLRVRLTFTDQTQKELDLAALFHGPIFDALRCDRELFRSVRVDSRAGTIVWPNGADLDPDVLYHGLQPAWAQGQDVLA